MIRLDLDKLRQDLPLLPEGEPDLPEGVAHSSVIMPVFHKNGQDGFLLQKRNPNLAAHPGQISFPGGVKEPEDPSLLETALREWNEEMGAAKEDLSVIGNYKGQLTHTGFHITPFLAQYSGDFLFQINPEEVERVIQLEFDRLWTVPFYSIQGRRRPEGPYLEVFYFDLEEGMLWGATARIIVDFLRDHSSFSRTPELRTPNLAVAPYLDPSK
ncbi:CoA pyrophosphatase [Leptospira langatensis]|uniref:CoA pyrophosphatase n=1 Tax=Leptospira langatensis TaxID=2484983 RepID=A0A5F1ZTY2_9LEPT|nr:CoA pyrophosphatase [Leptospira langatensis]TGK02961.1 CoA pyrophosphatase [Leptospira langatensis]TGL41716.1 CoA pyrophosphatase [Leptospira langatensis]